MHNFTSSGPRFSQLCTIKGYVSFRINQKPVVSNLVTPCLLVCLKVLTLYNMTVMVFQPKNWYASFSCQDLQNNSVVDRSYDTWSQSCLDM